MVRIELSEQQAKFLEEVIQYDLQEEYLSNFARKTYIDVLEQIRVGLESVKMPVNEF